MQVGGCRIDGELERSPARVVYRALHLALNRPVAVQVLLRSAAASPEVRQRFVAEAQALTRLQHPSVERVHEVGEASGNAYVAVEPAPGAQPIGALLQQRPEPLPVFTAVQIAAHLASALEHCHQQGVVHRDVSIGSVLITAEGLPILTGFGVTKDLDASLPGVAETGRAMGTPGYSSPEQASGQVSRIGPTVDVYGLGAVLYTLLVRRTPIVGNTPVEIMAATVSQAPAPPSSIRPEVPASVEQVCMRCLAKQPEQRYGSASELRAALEGLLGGGSAEAPPRVRLSQPAAGAPPAAEAIAEPIGSVVEEVDASAAKGPTGSSSRRSRSKVGSVNSRNAPAEGGEPVGEKPLPVALIAGAAVGVLLLIGVALAVLLSGGEPPKPVSSAPEVATVGSESATAVQPEGDPADPLAPQDPVEAKLAEGLRLLDDEDSTGAVRVLGELLDLAPDLALAYHARGNAHYQLADYESALADFEKAAELEPDAPEAHHNRGAAAESLDRLEVAVQAYERFLELSPRSDVASAVRADLKRLRKQLGG